MPRDMTSATFIGWLLRHTKLRGLRLSSARYPVSSDIHGEIMFALSWWHFRQSDDPNLSHASALWVHGLGGSAREVYVNHEQRDKPPNDSSLTQDAIDRAFKNQPRHTRLIYQMAGTRITILNGKYTNRLAVQEANIPTGDPVEVTSLERTLIDVT